MPRGTGTRGCPAVPAMPARSAGIRRFLIKITVCLCVPLFACSETKTEAAAKVSVFMHAMCCVYNDANPCLKVAPIKGEDQLLSFQTEIAILKECQHENLTNFVGAYYNKTEGNLWIIIENCSGGSVNDVLMKRRVRGAGRISLLAGAIHPPPGVDGPERADDPRDCVPDADRPLLPARQQCHPPRRECQQHASGARRRRQARRLWCATWRSFFFPATLVDRITPLAHRTARTR